jgi:pimeloyl-ACP methyl ester carboxylesterase
MEINILEKVNINNSGQWILVRGKNVDTPMILYVQAGPGLPIIPEARTLGKLLHLEDRFIVVYWDQRGCGKSFSKNIDSNTINLSQLTEDVIECTNYLLNKYNKDKLILSGYSIGASLSLLAAGKESNIFSHLFLTGIDINIPSANKFAVEFITTRAREKNNNRLLKRVTKLDNKPVFESKIFQERAKLLTDLGGIKTGSSYNQLLMSAIRNMLCSKAYSLRDIFKTIKGMEFCQNTLLPEMDTFNLFEKIQAVNVPVHFIQGKLDGIAPYQTAENFYKYLKADTKTFSSFDNSAHMPHYEEPEKFAKLIVDKVLK